MKKETKLNLKAIITEEYKDKQYRITFTFETCSNKGSAQSRYLGNALYLAAKDFFAQDTIIGHFEQYIYEKYKTKISKDLKGYNEKS